MNPQTMALACATAMLLGSVSNAGAKDRVRIANEGEIDNHWVLVHGPKAAAPGYPAQYLNHGDAVCIALGYAINVDGTTSDISLLDAWTSTGGNREPMKGYFDAFARAAAWTVAQWKFQPHPDAPAHEPTDIFYTVGTLGFAGSSGRDPAAIRNQCRISDFPSFIQTAKAREFRRGSLVRTAMDRVLRATPSGRAYGK